MRTFIGTRPLSRDLLLLGRDDDLRRLRNLLLADRVVLLLGRSGCGKTSLIDGLGGLRDVLQREFPSFHYQDAGLCLDKESPDCKLYGKVTKKLEEYRQQTPLAKGLLVVLDQLERGFQWTHMPQLAERLFGQVGQLILENKDTTFLLVLQEEHLAELQAIRRMIPGQLTIQYRLAGFEAAQVREIVGTLSAGNSLSAAFQDKLTALLEKERTPEQNTVDPFTVQALGWLLEDAWDPRRIKHSRNKVAQEKARNHAADKLEQEISRWGLVSCYLDRCLRAVPLSYSRSQRTGVLAKLSDAFLNADLGRQSVPIPDPPTSEQKASDSFVKRCPQVLWSTLRDWGVLQPAESLGLYQVTHDRLISALRLARHTHKEVQRQKRPWVFTVMLLLSLLLLLSAAELKNPVWNFLRQTPARVKPTAADYSRPEDKCPPPEFDIIGLDFDVITSCTELTHSLEAKLNVCLDRERAHLTRWQAQFSQGQADLARLTAELKLLKEENAELKQNLATEQRLRRECQPMFSTRERLIGELCVTLRNNRKFLDTVRLFNSNKDPLCRAKSPP